MEILDTRQPDNFAPQPRRLDATETAKLVRAQLKRHWPGVKFSVRTDRYSMGASVNVTWTDGPPSKAVDKVAGIYSGADFDGMVDLKTHSQHWLNPDGSVTIARSGGQGSTVPEYIGDPPHPSAELVSMGADYVISQRTISGEWRASIFRLFAAKIGRPLGDPEDWSVWRSPVPLAVDRRTGELLRMVDTDTEDVSVVFHQFTGCRARYGVVTFRCDPETGELGEPESAPEKAPSAATCDRCGRAMSPEESARGETWRVRGTDALACPACAGELAKCPGSLLHRRGES